MKFYYRWQNKRHHNLYERYDRERNFALRGYHAEKTRYYARKLGWIN